MTPREIDKQMQDVVDFTELGDYLEIPVRTYSSGSLSRWRLVSLPKSCRWTNGSWLAMPASFPSDRLRKDFRVAPPSFNRAR
jgi:hypothetical protein